MPAPLAATDLSIGAEVLARAFQDDPGTVFFFPDAERRAAMLPAMFDVMIRYGLKHGEVYATPNVPSGVAIWLPPGKTTPEEAGLGDAGIGEVAGKWGEEAMGRLGTLVGYLETLHGQLVDGPHWRLFFLGVEPEHQGEGLGSALLRARPAAASDNAPTYLETFTMPNVLFYQRHGYRIVGENDMPGSGIHVWSMLGDEKSV